MITYINKKTANILLTLSHMRIHHTQLFTEIYNVKSSGTS